MLYARYLNIQLLSLIRIPNTDSRFLLTVANALLELKRYKHPAPGQVNAAMAFAICPQTSVRKVEGKQDAFRIS